MASFQWPIDKISLINSALTQCGDNEVAVADDGSDEWRVGSASYERALAYMMERHGWVQATEIRTLPAAVGAPADTDYDTAYAFPPDLVHLTSVEVNGRTADWALLNNQIIVNANAGADSVTIRGVFSTNSDPVYATPTCILALESFVMSGIYRGLHEDPGEADKRFAAAMNILAHAKARHDMQKPKRAFFNSRIRAARLIRRPWPPVPSGWGGTGIPG
jgi:hypothetical protein